MAMRILNRSFSGGEITPELFGRLDLSKVQEALALCRNFITLPHGPAINRPGTEFVKEVKTSANATRLIPFSYNNTQTFAVEVGAGYFRFHTQGATLAAGTVAAYVAPATVTISLANPAVVTWTAHGMEDGTPVIFSSTLALPAQIVPGQVYYVLNSTTNNFQLATIVGGSAISTVAATSTVTITIATPGVVTWNNHGLPNGAAVDFTTTGALPTGLTAGTTYYVIAATINTFEVAATPGGAAINTSGTQSGTHTCTATQAGTHTGNRQYNRGDMALSGVLNYYCIASSAGNAPPNATYWYAMPPDGTYEIPNPYAAGDLFNITYTQSADVMTLCHQSYPTMELRRYGASDWRLVQVHFSPVISAPAGSASPGNPVAHTYAVLAYGTAPVFYSTGGMLTSEPVQFITALSASSSCNNDLALPGAYNTITWTAVPYVASYQVYKQSGGSWYYLATTTGLSFRDDSSKNITTATPPSPQYTSGTAAGTISEPVGVTATGYAANTGATSLTATPTGTGTVSYSYQCTAVDEGGNESGVSNTATCTNDLTVAGQHNTLAIPQVAGAVRYNIYKLSYGAWGYIGQAAGNSFVDDNIVADISRTAPITPVNVFASSNDYPAAVSYYQQRRIFAGTINEPQNVWATRSGTETDMSYTLPSRDDNRLAFRIAGREASAIRHIVPMQDMLFLSASCEWRCTSATGVLTPSTINVQPQSYIGASNVQPVVVGNVVLYGAARGGHIRQMGYNWQINGYQSTDASIFAPHLFDYNAIVDMAYSRGPIPILWCVSSNGKLLGMTWLPEQQISAWHQHDTGVSDVFESVCVIAENDEDMLYCVVNRTLNGVQTRCVERLHTRLYNTLEDAHYVDCGYTFTAPAVSGSYTVDAVHNIIQCTITNHGLTNGGTYWFYFTDTNYGALPGGSPYVVTVTNANQFNINVSTVYSTSSGTVNRLPTSVTGLTWLEGTAVNILADGAVLPPQTVTGGTVTFPVGVSTAHIGLPITAQIQTPPAAQAVDGAMAQGLVKNVNKVFLRTYRSSGILAGPDFHHLVPYRQRTVENPGSAPAMVSDEVEIVLDAAWGASGQVCIQQSDPLPLDIAAMTLEIATGGGV